ncbi:MAG: hypothetical protein AAF449_02420 [Myxococcota bacterium]
MQIVPPPPDQATWIVLASDPGVPTIEIAEGMIIALRRSGSPAIGLKPIDIDCPYTDDHDLVSPDGDRLWRVSGCGLPPLVVAPYRFAAGGDPVAAAKTSGLSLELSDVLTTVEEAQRFGRPVVIMGPPRADGPFVTDGSIWDLGQKTEAHVVLVVDDARRETLPSLQNSASQAGLRFISVARTAEPIVDAVHLPPSFDTQEVIADRIAPALIQKITN